jgi:hypothetical protein
MSREPALLNSEGRMPKRSQHRVSEGHDGRSERPATGHGQHRTVYTPGSAFLAAPAWRDSARWCLTVPPGLTLCTLTSGDGAWAAPNACSPLPYSLTRSR